MPGPPRQFDEHAVLCRALKVFWDKGYEATSVQDLVQATGINRASMYAAFGDKRALFDRAMQQYCADMLGVSRQRLEQGPGSPLERLRAYLGGFSERFTGETRCGCFAINTAVELGPHDGAVAARLRRFFEDLEAIMLQALQQACEAGELPPDCDIQGLSRFFCASIQGLSVMSKIGRDPHVLQDILAQIMARLDAAATRPLG